MNPDTLVIVSAYAGDRQQVDELMPVWVHHGCSVVLVTPLDSPIDSTSQSGVVFRHVGLRGWIGPQTLERQRQTLAMCLEYPFGHFLLNDSDSFCLTPDIPRYCYGRPDVIWSNEVLDTNPGPSRLPKLAMQPPYFLSRKSIEGMLRAAQAPPASYYHPEPHGNLPVPTNCIDHYMLQLACGSGHEHWNHFDGACMETRVTVEPAGLETMSDLVRGHGKRMIHSVKSGIIMHRLLRDRLIWQTVHQPK